MRTRKENEQKTVSLIAGGWDDREGSIILSDKEKIPTTFTINWEIDILSGEKGRPHLQLRRLDLVSQRIDLPYDRSGILSITSVPLTSGTCDLAFEEKSGEFSGTVPLLIHMPIEVENLEFIEGEGCPNNPTRRFIAMARFEGRFHNSPGFGKDSERPLELEAEVRGLSVRPGEEQEWDFLAPRFALATTKRFLGPPQVAPFFHEIRPAFDGFEVKTLGSGTDFPIPVCQYHAPLRRLKIQPIFVDARGYDPLDPDKLRPVRDLPRNPHIPGGLPTADLNKISGKSFETVMQQARDLWGRVCLEFEVLPPKALRDEDYFELNSYLEAGQFTLWVNPDGKAIRVFVANRWNLSGQARPSGDPAPSSVFKGGTYAHLGGTASAYIMTVDSQIDIPATGPDRCLNGASGAVNMNHLAHEIGHVLGLNHPDDGYSMAVNGLPALYPATKGSLMEPSGYCADNPGKNSRGNGELMHNPLLRTVGYTCGSPDIDDIVNRWWENP